MQYAADEPAALQNLLAFDLKVYTLKLNSTCLSVQFIWSYVNYNVEVPNQCCIKML